MRRSPVVWSEFGSFAARGTPWWDAAVVGRGAPARFAVMLVVLLTAHAAAVPRVQRVLAALEADLDALERIVEKQRLRNFAA